MLGRCKKSNTGEDYLTMTVPQTIGVGASTADRPKETLKFWFTSVLLKFVIIIKKSPWKKIDEPDLGELFFPKFGTDIFWFTGFDSILSWFI